MELTNLDLWMVGFYAVILFWIAMYVSRKPAGVETTTEDYFLAGKSLPWWAIGASLIAANISAEQIIGMSGEGYRIGLAIAAYEWQAAIVLIIVAKYFLPIFLKREIYTMPQFLSQRYGTGVKTTMPIYWIALYTLVNLTSVLWLGGLAVESLTGFSVFWSMLAMGSFALAYSVFGGLKAVALTDIIQVIVLIIGGIIIAVSTVSLIGGGSFFGGFERIYTELPGKFDMILEPSQTGYDKLPGIWTLLGGLWVLHLSYWGFNQYIIQRALGAKDVVEAQKGLLFAAGMKLIMPFIIVLPGIAAVMLVMPEIGGLDANILNKDSDKTYPEIMKLVKPGLRGIIFAALIAAIISSLASMVNSISTIFTMDVYKPILAKGRSEKHYVGVGRLTAVLAMLIAVVAAQPFLGGFDSAFQTVQDYTGFIAPGIVAVFLLGMFHQSTNSAGAFTALILSVLMSLLFKFAYPDFEFVNRIWVIFLLCIVLGVAVSHIAELDNRQKRNVLVVIMAGLTGLALSLFKYNALNSVFIIIFASMVVGTAVSYITASVKDGQLVRMKDVKFSTTKQFNVWTIIIVIILIALYAVFW